MYAAAKSLPSAKKIVETIAVVWPQDGVAPATCTLLSKITHPKLVPVHSAQPIVPTTLTQNKNAEARLANYVKLSAIDNRLHYIGAVEGAGKPICPSRVLPRRSKAEYREEIPPLLAKETTR